MRHDFQVIEKIKKLRTNGFTLTEIVNETDISKSTILHHIKNIPQSKYLKEKIRLSRLEAQKVVAASRRGKSVKTYSFLKPEKWNDDLVNLIAHFLFDGRITRTSCIYYNRSEALIHIMLHKMKNLLKVSDYKTYETPNGVKRIAYHHVEIAAFVRKKAGELLHYIGSAPIEHKISFLKASFDDEGSVTFSKNKRMVRGYQHSVEILDIIKGLLNDLEIESRIDKKYFELYIYHKENLLRFQKLINFSSGIKVNGNRSNSIWKRHLEKRKILEMAINSYL